MRALWSDRQNCSHNVSQKVKRISRFSEERQKKGEKGLNSAELIREVRADTPQATPPFISICGSPIFSSQRTLFFLSTKKGEKRQRKAEKGEFADVFRE